MILKDRDTWFGPTLDAFDYLDPDTGLRRPFTLKDCKTTSILADALDNFSWVMTIGVCSDAPAAISDKLIAKEVLTNCSKPLLFCCNTIEAMKDIYEMGVIIADDEECLINTPNIIGFQAPISPLTYDDGLIDRLLFAAEKGLSQVCYSGPQAALLLPEQIHLNLTIISGLVWHNHHHMILIFSFCPSGYQPRNPKASAYYKCVENHFEELEQVYPKGQKLG